MCWSCGCCTWLQNPNKLFTTHLVQTPIKLLFSVLVKSTPQEPVTREPLNWTQREVPNISICSDCTSKAKTRSIALNSQIHIIPSSHWFSLIPHDSFQFSMILADSQWFFPILDDCQIILVLLLIYSQICLNLDCHWFLLILEDSCWLVFIFKYV